VKRFVVRDSWPSRGRQQPAPTGLPWRRWRRVVRQLSIPEPFDLAEMLRRLAERRGRPIRLQLVDMADDSPCGVWVALADTDYIFIERRTSSLHQHHIGLHEVAHMLLEHTGGELLSDDLLRRLFPDLDPTVVRSALGRTGYTAKQERDAEKVAFRILTKIKRFAPLPDDTPENDRMARLLHPAPPPSS
jgi:hypothetical protein